METEEAKLMTVNALMAKIEGLTKGQTYTMFKLGRLTKYKIGKVVMLDYYEFLRIASDSANQKK